jgi:hypothetical protein
MIRGKKVDRKALADLTFSRKRIAVDVKKALESAIANAENNHDLDVDALVVAEAYVGKSLVMKRFMPRGTRPRRPYREAVFAPDDCRACAKLRRPPNGSESQSDRLAPRHQPHLGLALVRRQWRVCRAAARRSEDPRVHPEERFVNSSRRAVSKIVIERPHKKCRVTIHTARPGHHRQEGRRHREAAPPSCRR